MLLAEVLCGSSTGDHPSRVLSPVSLLCWCFLLVVQAHGTPGTCPAIELLHTAQPHASLPSCPPQDQRHGRINQLQR